MRPTNLSIHELLNENEKLTFLVGAGCSIDPPSCLPAGRSMMECLLHFSCAPSELDTVLSLKQLRFEALVEILSDLIDPHLHIIDYYGLCDKPNLQHFFLAEMIKKGHFVMTTNFDFLIEHALLQSGVSREKIKVVITKNDFEGYNNPELLFQKGFNVLYKIHIGSARKPRPLGRGGSAVR